MAERREQMNEHQATYVVAQSQPGPRTRSRAEAKIIVQHSEAKPYDQTVSPALMEISINETFTGDIDGQSQAISSICR
jgi:hypothetical protein